MKTALLFVAFVATIYATASYLTAFYGDFTAAAVVAVVALGGVFLVDEVRRG